MRPDRTATPSTPHTESDAADTPTPGAGPGRPSPRPCHTAGHSEATPTTSLDHTARWSPNSPTFDLDPKIEWSPFSPTSGPRSHLQSQEWPTTLPTADGAPIALWARGDGHLVDLTARSITVTGTRSPSVHGVGHTRRFAGGLATATPPVTVTAAVSAGIGLQALTSAALHGPTLALLTSSAPACLTRYGSLLAVVASRGVVLSLTPPLVPAPPGTGEQGRRLATRITLLGALSPAVLVIEAETAGQAMTLARAAHGRDRLVMAVPAGHPLTDRHHGGCHQLLHGGLAVPAVTVDDITARLPTG
ncbi:DNA-processing protein DprA [Parafrankia discariae]|uniref:DNA-processing protein DprA n=1 Tax=Parafrankia discariae TaxID=365528 RepID=UPI000A000769|nr:DNA-processing protein DprA [Parafrankia discariae]